MINNYLNFISSKKSQITIFILLNICGLIFIFLPHNIFVNMIDLKLSYDTQDVYDAFDAMGQDGRAINLYSSLILDMIYPILYVSLILGAYVKLYSENNYVLIVPIFAGVSDIAENIQSAIMNLSYASLTETQVKLASLTTSLKWFFILLMVAFLVIPTFKKKFKKFRKSFLRRYLFLMKREKFIFKLNNILLKLDIRDSIDREIFFNGYYEEKQIKFLLDNIIKYNITIFIDVGANVGIYSLIVAKKISNIKVYSFEPHIGAFKRLEENIQLNHLHDKVEIQNLALSDTNQDGFLLSPPRFGSNQSGGAKVHSSGNLKISQAIGDDVMAEINKKIALKIDVEGFEFAVLKGLKNLFKNNKVFLQIEIFDENFSAISKLLEEFKFKLIFKGVFTHQNTVKDYFYINF